MKPTRATSANRLAIYAIAWLLVGSAINYAQAVVFAMPLVGRQTKQIIQARPDERLVISRTPLIASAWYSSDESARVHYQQNPVVPARPSWLRIRPVPPSFDGLEARFQAVWGWPLRNLTYSSETSIQHSGSGHTRYYGLWRPMRNLDVPLIPLWPGFLLNALIWGSPVLLVPLVNSRRRVRRRRRGLCARCGYDLRSGALTSCPECGPSGPESREPPENPELTPSVRR